MSEIDPVVKKETGYIAFWTLIFSVIMEAVFIILKRWNITVLFGNILGAAAVILNFFLMGLSIQKALDMSEEDAAKSMKLSQRLRNLMIIVIIVIGFAAPVFSPWSTIIPLFFTRIAVGIRPLMDRRRGGNS